MEGTCSGAPQLDARAAIEGARRTARVGLRGAALAGATVCGLGWTYALRNVGWLAAGPRIEDALPLLQLAGFDGQSVALLLLAWLPAGAVAGLRRADVCPLRGAAAAGLTAAVLLGLASQASYALARNARFAQVLHSRVPGPGVWVEALLFAAGAALPSLVHRARLRGARTALRL